ncbi:ABC transporter permease [Natronoglycomyces albus]|uniref:ABC transporter permease n=1 Tax=Natronoglycomyces albus TaxID=2811108 RepID=A0A895XNH4_9ACTN|nr:ABC transporter permease [Natronoglycomyces albus]QSB06677.1 ABC transporter permease [Natronoglycomyces albus]
MGAVLTGLFLLTEMLPSDLADVQAGADVERAEQLRHIYGLDQPIGVRLWDWWSAVFSGDLGHSLIDGSPVWPRVADRLINTAAIAMPAILIAAVATVALALVLSWNRGRPVATRTSVGLAACAGLPEAVLTVALVALLSVRLGWVPSVSLLAPGQQPWDRVEILLLPVLSLAIPAIAWSTRMLKGSSDDIVSLDVVVSARLRGMPAHRVILRHVLPRMRGPLAQVFAVMAAGILGGSVIVESLLAYPGIGQLLSGAVAARDTPMVQGAGLVLVVVSMSLYTAADLIVDKGRMT